MEKQKIKRYRGVTLLEVLTGLFIFTTVILATTGIFASSFKIKRETQDAQKRYIAAFNALGEVGKILSTSTIIQDNPPSGSDSSILVFNYSESGSECKKFTFENNKLTVKERNVLPTGKLSDCTESFLGGVSATTVAENITGRFMWRKLSTRNPSKENNKSGMITISSQVYSADPGGTPTPTFIPIQTTVSLRDYLVD